MPIIADVVKSRDREDVPLTTTHLRTKIEQRARSAEASSTG